MLRLRIVYKKSGNCIYTGTLDMQKIWERAIRRAGLKLAYSQGFHPQPRIQQAAPLPLGFTGLEEIVDIWMDENGPKSDWRDGINNSLPQGIQVSSMLPVELSDTSLQNRVCASIYEARIPAEFAYPDLSEKIISLLKAKDMIIERRGKKIDLRIRINTLELLYNKDDETSLIRMELKQLPGLTGRPEDVLNALAIDPVKVTIERVHLVIT
jgi:radical SAM-linked protein